MSKYRNIIGDLRYLADCTRPDLSYIFGRRGTEIDKPTATHYKMMKATLRNLAETGDYGLYFQKSKTPNDITTEVKVAPIITSSDEDWDNDRVERKSVTGGLITLYEIPVAWKSRKQSAVAMLTPDE